MWHLQKIPKTVHFYWGSEKLSFLRYLTVLSFKKLNPDWTVKLYFPKEKYLGEKTWSSPEHNGRYEGENFAPRLLTLDISITEIDFSRWAIPDHIPEPFKADFFRWKVLANEGGLWSDFDIVYFKPVEELYFNTESDINTDTVICVKNNPQEWFHSIGFLMSAPENSYYKFIYDQAYPNFNPGIYQSIGSHIPNAYFPTVTAARERFPHLTFVNLPMDVVYPYHEYCLLSLFYGNDQSFITSNTIGIHWYAGGQDAVKWENMLTENNFRDYDTVLANTIARVMDTGAS